MKSLFIVAALLIASGSTQDLDLNQVRCLVCRTIIDEFLHDVGKIDPKREIEVGQYRLDPKGNMLQKKIPLAQSKVHLSELLEGVCKRMQDYVRATYKSNGKLTLMKLVTDNGLNPLMNEVDIVQDGDLNKSLEYFCEEVINDYEDDIVTIVSKKQTNVKNQICSKAAGYCEDVAGDSDDGEDEAKDGDEEDYDKTEL